SETNATNQMMLRTSSVTGRSESAISGFFHTQLEDIPISFPPVSTPTTYYLALTYDPRREEEEAGPIRIEVHTNNLPTTHGRQHIVLYTVERQPNQLLTQATITRTLPWLGHVINVWYESDLPDPTTVEYGTLAVVINPGRAPANGPGLYSCRGIHGWLNLQQGEWENLSGFGGWDLTNAMARYRNGGVDVTGFFVRDSNNTGNRHRPARLPEGLRPKRLVRGLLAHISRPPYVLPIQVDTSGDITFYGSEVEGGWVGINAFIPDHYF
ncbi:MAG TPA: hypothetical protein VK054_07940, partial [Beutenbergiaceae bacterium]|nr:hypothetical protein [Beutenbergiaceae bacterium]